MEELKPCPFCGSKQVSRFMKMKPWSKYPLSRWRHGAYFYGVGCENLTCNAEVKWFLSSEDAVAAWNRRAWL